MQTSTRTSQGFTWNPLSLGGAPLTASSDTKPLRLAIVLGGARAERGVEPALPVPVREAAPDEHVAPVLLRERGAPLETPEVTVRQEDDRRLDALEALPLGERKREIVQAPHGDVCV